MKTRANEGDIVRAGELSEIIRTRGAQSTVVVDASGQKGEGLFINSPGAELEVSAEEWAARVDFSNKVDDAVCVGYSWRRYPRYDIFATERTGGYFKVVKADVEDGVVALTIA